MNSHLVTSTREGVSAGANAGGEGIKRVASQDRGAYTRCVSSDHAAEVAAALQTLARTGTELDEAVAAAAEIDGSYVFASPEIRALLVQAVKARNHLDSVLSSTRRSPWR